MHYIIPKEDLRINETAFRVQGEEYAGFGKEPFSMLSLWTLVRESRKNDSSAKLVQDELMRKSIFSETICGAVQRSSS